MFSFLKIEVVFVNLLVLVKIGLNEKKYILEWPKKYF